MVKELVSIVVPCYNGEKYIDDCLRAILNQTYKQIQLIVVDDGSKDNSLKLLKSYEGKFKKKGMELIVLHQENQGQAAAVNYGLKKVSGEYLAWQDIDDYYENDAIENLIQFLKEHKDCVAVRGEAVLRDEKQTERIIKFAKSKYPNETNIFDFYVFENDSYMYPGIFLVRMMHFDKRIKDREIYTSRAGQNWQLILPIAYKSNVGYLNKVVYNYRYVDNSHSHSVKKISKLLERSDTHQDVLIKVISDLNMAPKEFERYKNKIRIKYIKQKIRIILSGIKRKVVGVFYEKNSR